MKTVIATGLACCLLAGSGIAQTPTPATEAQAQPGRMSDTDSRSGPTKSARFRLQVGHIFLGLTCPDDEPMKACAEFAMQLLDKADSMQKR